MTAIDFYNAIKQLQDEFSRRELDSYEFLVQEALKGTAIYKKECNTHAFKNEIDVLICSYNLAPIGYLLRDITFYDEIIEAEDELCLFGYLDSYLCYNKADMIYWCDYDTLEELSPVAISPEHFLDAMYEVARNSLYRNQSKEELSEKLVNLSEARGSSVFFNYLLGIY